MFETFVGFMRRISPEESEPPKAPKKIFVLRNNDIGDLLVITPLFDALKRIFPDAAIIAGVGSWNREVLLGNPHVSQVLSVNAPWHNKFVQPQGVVTALKYIYQSDEVDAIVTSRADLGIDVLGSGFGSLLMMRAGIPFRMGVRGYAGGESGTQCFIEYRSEEHVGRQAIRFAELLGCVDLPENRPQLFLDKFPEVGRSIVIAPGTGLPEKGWPESYYIELGRLLKDFKLVVIGSKAEGRLASLMRDRSAGIVDLTGKLSLRESFAIIGAARLLISNPSMAMHAAAAFHRPVVVLLGMQFPSAVAHHRQWGYPEAIHLGREKDRPTIFSPDEAITEIRQIFTQL
jgi:ADP-heptose:LPS heptosyltransferase